MSGYKSRPSHAIKEKTIRGFHKITEEALSHLQSLKSSKNKELFSILKTQEHLLNSEKEPNQSMELWKFFPFQKFKDQGKTKQSPFKSSINKKVNSFFSPLVVSVYQDRLETSFSKQGFSIYSWGDLWQRDRRIPKLVQKKILESVKCNKDYFSHLNSVLSRNGIILIIESQMESPIEIHYRGGLLPNQSMACFQSFIFVQPQASAKIRQVFFPEGSQDFSLKTQIFLDQDSCLDLLSLDQPNSGQAQFQQLSLELEKQARIHFCNLHLFSDCGRLELITHQKKSSRVDLKGLNLLREKGYAEDQIFVNHLEEEGESSQIHRSIVFGEARSVFRGHIRIPKQAQKTDANQLSKSWIFGKSAMAVALPELDVTADDVKAHHGASISPLNENDEKMFFLQSRGLSKQEALELLLSSLIEESLGFLDSSTKESLEKYFFKDFQSWIHKRD